MRKGFSNQKPERVFKQLDKLQLEAFPDLQIAAHRLRILAKNSERLDALTGHEFGDKIRDQLWKILLASAQEAGSLKSQVVFWMANIGSRRRLLRAIRWLQTEVPEVYELERDWFETLEKLQVKEQIPQAPETESSWNARGIVIWLCVMGLLQVLRASSGCTGPSTAPRIIPRMQDIRMQPAGNGMRPEEMEKARQFIEAHMKRQSERQRQLQPQHDK